MWCVGHMAVGYLAAMIGISVLHNISNKISKTASKTTSNTNPNVLLLCLLLVFLVSQWPDSLRLMRLGFYRPLTHNLVVAFLVPMLPALLLYSVNRHTAALIEVTVAVTCSSAFHVCFDCVLSSCYPFAPVSWFRHSFGLFNSPVDHLFEAIATFLFIYTLWRKRHFELLYSLDNCGFVIGVWSTFIRFGFVLGALGATAFGFVFQLYMFVRYGIGWVPNELSDSSLLSDSHSSGYYVVRFVATLVFLAAFLAQTILFVTLFLRFFWISIRHQKHMEHYCGINVN